MANNKCVIMIEVVPSGLFKQANDTPRLIISESRSE